jgi:hypothetical protein
VIVDVGGADQREVALVRNRKHDAAVGMLEDVGAIVVEQFAHDDVAALDQPQRLGCRLADGGLQELRGPRPARIDKTSRCYARHAAARPFQRSLPVPGVTHGRDAARVGQDSGAVVKRADRIEHHQARIVDRGIRIHEAAREPGLQRPPPLRACAGRCRASQAAVRGAPGGRTGRTPAAAARPDARHGRRA